MIKICKYCGTEFESKNRSLYCSDACRLTGKDVRPIKQKKEKPKVTHKCLYCGKDFEAKRSNQNYCSKLCYNKEMQKTYVIEKPLKKPKYTIEEIQRLARAEGLTYGQYIARHGI
jgi:hypothetical protein